MTYSPWDDLASRPDITLATHRLPTGRSWWLPADSAVVLDDRLDQVGRRCALAHELVHADRGDSCHPDSYPDRGRQAARAETACRAETARRLIPVRHLADALCAHAHDLAHLADELWVTTEVVTDRLHHLHPAERHYLRRRLEDQELAA